MGVERTTRNPGFGSCGQYPNQICQQAVEGTGKKDLLIPADIILDNILEDRADIPINAIHMYSGLKADLYPVREGDELRQSAFQRRQQVDYGPPIGNVYIHSPEDLILYKLMYFGLSQQSKHSRDIAAILKSKKNELDLNYIEGWASRLGLSSLWKEMLDNNT
jgi:hypothetical protein